MKHIYFMWENTMNPAVQIRFWWEYAWQSNVDILGVAGKEFSINLPQWEKYDILLSDSRPEAVNGTENITSLHHEWHFPL